jgi:hypothetical protein
MWWGLPQRRDYPHFPDYPHFRAHRRHRHRQIYSTGSTGYCLSTKTARLIRRRQPK